MDLLNTENLVELHEKLNEFATHHRNMGGQDAHRLIKNKLVDKAKSQDRDGSKEGLFMHEGYDRAIRDVLYLLREEFIP